MKLFKRAFLCLILAVTCVFAALSFTACGNKPTEGLQYTVITKDGTPASYKVTGMGTATDTKILIPSTYNGLPVTEVGANAFYKVEKITSVSLPESVTSIADYSFYGCSALKKINIPEGVVYIGNASFYKCKSLTSITVPSTVRILGSLTFAECTALKSVQHSDGIKYIGMQMFQGCTSLTSVKIPDSVTSYGAQSFSNCTALKSFGISANVKEIGIKAFEGCSALKSAKFANTSGWKAKDTTSDESLTVSSELLSDASMAATYLTSTYRNYVWKRS